MRLITTKIFFEKITRLYKSSIRMYVFVSNH